VPSLGRYYRSWPIGLAAIVAALICQLISGRCSEVLFGPCPTVCRGILRLTADGRQLTASRLELLDVAGRVVLTRPLDHTTAGPLSVDVRHLAPGAYFVRSASGIKKLLVLD